MVPTMPPDAHKISLKIIEAIKQHPVLYISDVKGTAIKLQEFRQKVWKRISDELGLDPAWVRLRWKNLRDTYCRILKYKNRTNKGSRRKKWVFEDHLSFLKFPYEPDYQPQCVELSDEYIEEINASGMSTENLLEQLEDRSDEDYSEYLEVLEETAADPILQDDSQVVEILDCVNEEDLNPEMVEKDSATLQVESYAREIENNYIRIRPKKMKFDHDVQLGASNVSPNDGTKIDSNINTIVISTSDLPAPEDIETTENDHNDQDNDHEISLDHSNPKECYAEELPKTSIELFFDSMAQTVRLLPPKAQAEVKMSVCRIVTEAEVKYSNKKNIHNVQKFIAPPGMIPKLVLIPCSMIDNPSNSN
ncbi:uncharacterized protein LOC107048442 [Diachasma alloeum]|uniref:uncharacterized protein LOC107048442 n=1 Tax=Diachasma alloeum TaxID=454923 RepID=UPI0007384FEB|nr:uncharacterized protein LOC107048442 [Diachasma alloeum]